ncbi:helix-turn-helix domain-containing protein [Nocardia yamanashiensis]|uniref:helix-turn-helix domain-containing protein n=1 Tax=Nocardia yamanashiensis TaxID=209247 RepID=UPI001E321D21|nr:helix-turn-helix domain-containing protein [Nocardia yamanashiensis]UGT43306.1 helix-turn-helix domain-containing protein [Nocardia yamanashiensis]
MTSDSATVDPAHPALAMLAPLLERVGGRLIPAAECLPDDVPLVWEGQPLAAVRFASSDSESEGGIRRLLNEVAAEFGTPLADLPRAEKQRAVRLLEERGAFSYRKSAETVAEALGVTRFTVYNYLNRTRS